MKIVSWNVNGLRAVLKKGDLQNFVQEYKPDILCLQETKAKQGQAEVDFPQYEEIWNSAERAGYSGTAIFTAVKPLSINYGLPEEISAQFDFNDVYGDVLSEGRVLTCEFEDFYLVNTYVPNAKGDLSRLELREKIWDPALLKYLQKLDAVKPVLCCGDFNVAHEEMDLARPKENRGNAGFTDEERAGMDKYLAGGFVDSFRTLHPEEVRYSWWSYRMRAREKGIGWRIDYFLVSERFMKDVADVRILDDVMGSDHCPVIIELK